MEALTVTIVIKIVLQLTGLLLYMNAAEVIIIYRLYYIFIIFKDMINIGRGWEPIRINAVLTRKIIKNRP